MKFDYSNIPAPWIESYGSVKPNLDYPPKTMAEAVLDTAKADPEFTALSFMGRKMPYSALAANMHLAAKAFYALGIGAVPSMVHPLSAVGELVFYLNEASCDVAVTLDQFYAKFLEVNVHRHIGKLIIAHVSEELPFPLSFLQKTFTESKFPKLVEGESVLSWKSLMKMGENYKGEYQCKKDFLSEAVVLFSGGTTGVTKGIMLSDLNFNALACQTAEMAQEEVRHARMLAAMPVE